MRSRPQSQDIEGKLKKSLRERGYKLTPQRLEIIGLLVRDMTHPGAMDLLKKVRKKVPRISVSTIYYTLDMLKKEGLINEIEFYDQDNRYDINVTNHINLICKKCGRIEDFPGALPYTSDAIKEKTGFHPMGLRFEYYGHCKECASKGK